MISPHASYGLSWKLLYSAVFLSNEESVSDYCQTSRLIWWWYGSQKKHKTVSSDEIIIAQNAWALR